MLATQGEQEHPLQRTHHQPMIRNSTRRNTATRRAVPRRIARYDQPLHRSSKECISIDGQDLHI